MARRLVIRRLGTADYEPVWRSMQEFTEQRSSSTDDELWTVEHPPVFTLGRNGKREHLLNPGAIPVVWVDRGGQVTYHGPGQLVIYALLDLRRRGRGVRWLVNALEQSIVELLRGYGIHGYADEGAPGVYVDGAKVASLGLRVRRGCSYHGISLNVTTDTGPFHGINPCGHAGLAVTTLAELGVDTPVDSVREILVTRLAAHLGYDPCAAEAGSPTETVPS